MTRVSGPWLSDPSVQQVFDALDAAGHEAWCVGGAVRNALLQTPVADVDISTPARPDEVMAAAKAQGLKAVPTGIAHGTITVVADGEAVEVTTFRRDVATDGRRAVVAFTHSMEEDARRRDFTLNALYADRFGRVLDPLGGLPDLHARRIRFIDKAADRIREDRLRVLRFFRFHAWYGGGRDLDPEGLAASAAAAKDLAALSRERVGTEFRRLLAAPDPSMAVEAMAKTGVLDATLPGADDATLPALLALEKVEGIEPRWERRLAAVLDRDAQDLLRLSNAEARNLARILAASKDGSSAKARGYSYGLDAALDAALLRAARSGDAMTDGWRAPLEAGAAARFPIAAKDLIPRHGTGPALGAALAGLEERWLAADLKLDKAALLAIDAEQEV